MSHTIRINKTGIRNGLWLIRILHLEETVVSITGRNLATDNAVPQHPDFPGWCEAAFNIDGVIDTMETTTKEGFFMNALRLAPRRMVKALAAGAVLVASALPLVAATGAGAASVPAASYMTVSTPTVNTPGASGVASVVGAGVSGSATFVFSSTDAANLTNGANLASVTTTAAGVTFGSGTESVVTATQVVANFSIGATVTPGFYPVTVTDSTGSVTIANAFYVDPAATVTSVSPTTLVSGVTGAAITVTGTGFVSGATATLKDAFGHTLSTLGYTNSTTLSGSSANVPAGTYNLSGTNGDGSSLSLASAVTVTGPTLTSVAPASVALPTTTTSVTATLAVVGTNLQSAGYMTGSVDSGTGFGVAFGAATVASSTSVSVPVTVSYTTGSITAGQVSLTWHNPDGSSKTLAGGLGVGEPSTATATVTAVSSLPTLSVPGSASMTITGTGFGVAGNTATIQFVDPAGNVDSFVTCSSYSVVSNTQINCIVAVASGAISGPHSIQVKAQGGTLFSNALANAMTVAGPTISAVSPSVVPVNYGGTYTLTGTGFSTSDSYNVAITGSGTIAATAAATSATSVTVTVTSAASGIAGDSLLITLTDTTTGRSTDATASVAVSAPSSIGVVYAAGTTGVGIGATAQPVSITGLGFQPGATVAAASGSGITFTVTNITPTVISATVTVTSAATTGANAFTVTNSSGGTGVGSITIHASPGTLAASPTGFLAGAKAATLTITGAGFTTLTKLAASSSLITLGTATVVSGTTITVPVTVASVTGTYIVNWTLTVTNGDGGSSSIAMTVNPGPTVTGTYYVPTFSTNYQMVITGTGFMSGITVKSSNTDYSASVAQVASSTSLILLVTTTSAATAGTSSNVTLTNTDGSTVTFVLNGGPAPTPVPVLTQPHVTGVSSFVKTGMTRAITLTGLHFMKGLHITSVAGTTWKVMGVSPTAVRVQVTVTKASRIGWHRLTLTNPGGKSTTRAYQQK